MMVTKFQLVVTIVIFINIFYMVASDTQAEYELKITFYTFNINGFIFNSTFDDNTTLINSCSVSGNFTFIIHGWRESINSTWPNATIGNFSSFRGGCVFFMDYSNYSTLDYGVLFNNFNGIQAVLTRKLIQLYELGFDPLNGHVFGFSFGGHLTFEGLYQFYNTTKKLISRADVCDQAGPFFPPTSASVMHAKNCSRTVQCIHTSCGDGTCDRYCQKDINMGECGISQIGATEPPFRSHGMCPHIYNNAFIVDFPLLPRPTKCWPTPTDVNVTNLPNQVMGFRFNTSLPDGIYYSPTCRTKPWNSPTFDCPL